MLHDFLSSFILFSRSCFSLSNNSSVSDGDVVADDVTMRIFLPSVNIIHFDILICSVAPPSVINFTMPGFRADTMGV
jgi:hypothetical protein